MRYRKDQLLVNKWSLLRYRNQKPAEILKQLREYGLVTSTNAPSTLAYREGAAIVIAGMPFWDVLEWSNCIARMNKEKVAQRKQAV